MDKPIFVVDASTCLKWVLDDEILVTQARQLLKDYLQGKISLLTPNLWFYEITNGIRSACLRTRITSTTSRKLLKLLLKSRPQTVSLEDVLPQVLANALTYQVSAYDSAYITLAQINNLPLITSDQKLADRQLAGVRLITLAD